MKHYMRDFKKVDSLLNYVISKPRKGKVLNDLLEEFRAGYPLINLKKLLFHQDSRVQKEGIWIASELGIECKPIFKDVAKLMDHELPIIRSYLSDCVLVCAEKEDREAIAKIILYFTDSHEGVIWQAIQFLTRSSINQLRWGLSYFEDVIKDPIHIKGLNFLINSDKNNTREIVSLLNDKNAILRKYGLACADRVFRTNDKPLKLALESKYEEIKSLAIDLIDLASD